MANSSGIMANRGQRARAVLTVLMLMFWPASAWANYEIHLHDVAVNGEVRIESAFVIADGNGGFGIDEQDFATLRFPDDEAARAARIEFDGQPYVLLERYPNIAHEFDEENGVIRISANRAAFGLHDVHERTSPRVEPQSAFGGYVNYSVAVGASTEEADFDIAGAFDVNVFHGDTFGLLRSDFILHDEDGFGVTRLQTQVIKDFWQSRHRLTVGDSFTRISPIGGGRAFGGVKFEKAYSLDPTFRIGPAYILDEVIDTPSQVDIFVDGVLSETRDVDPGLFDMNLTGLGSNEFDTRIVITDALGRERVIERNFFNNPQLLAEGLADYSVEAGWQRERLGEESFSYGDVFASGTYRYGLTDRVNVTGGAAAKSDSLLVGGAVLAPGPLDGIVTGTAAFSLDSFGAGFQSGFTYGATVEEWSFGGAIRYTSENFGGFGRDFETEPPPAWEISGNVFRGFGDFGSLSFSAFYSDNRSETDRLLTRAGYGIGFGDANLFLSAAMEVHPSEDYVVSLSFIKPLGGGTVNASANYDGDHPSARAQYRSGSSGPNDGFSWAAAVDYDENVTEGSGAFLWRNKYADVTGAAVTDGDSVAVDAAAAGGFGFIKDEYFFSRPIGGGFALVEVGDLEGVPVFLENQFEGTTNDRGRIVVGDVGGYGQNRFTIEVDDVPFDYEIGVLELDAAPYFGAGVVVTFPVRQVVSATLTLVRAGGSAVAENTYVAGEEGTPEGWVGDSGFLYLTGLSPGANQLTAKPDGGEPCQFTVNVPESGGDIPELGKVTCK